MFHSNKIISAKKVKDPDFMNKEFDCPVCGGRFKVTPRTSVFVPTTKQVTVRCPYCDMPVAVDNDPHKNFRDKLEMFIKSQVEPIKHIDNEDVRLPMQKLLDDFYKCVLED